MMFGAFDAGHSSGDKQKGENAPGDLKYQHRNYPCESRRGRRRLPSAEWRVRSIWNRHNAAPRVQTA